MTKATPKADILYLAYWHGKGMAYTLAHQGLAILRQAEKAGFRCHIASTAGEVEPGLWDLVRREAPADQVHVLANENSALKDLALRLLNSSERPLVIDLHGIRQLQVLANLKKQFSERLKIVYEVHSYKNTSWKRLIYAFIATNLFKRYVDYVLFPSIDAAHSLKFSQKLFANGKAGIVPEGLEPWNEESCSRQPEGIPDNFIETVKDNSIFKFLYVAHFKKGKGHEWLVKAMLPTLQKHSNVRLLLPGDGYGTGIMDRVKGIAEKGDVGTQVVFSGYYPNNAIPWLVSNCDVGIVASRSETFGRNYLEPMMAGCPIIGTRFGAGEWLIMDFFTGIGFEYGDSKALRRAAEYMTNHPILAREMGQNAKTLFHCLFSWDRAARTNVYIYESIIE